MIVDPSASGFEGMIPRSEIPATGMNACGTWDIDREHFSPMLGHSQCTRLLNMMVGL